MTEYKAKSIETLIFSLTQSNNLVGKLTYNNWLSFKSSISLADNSSFQIEPKGFWGTTIEIKNKESVLMRMKMNWNSEDVLITSFGNEEQEFVFKYFGDLKKDSFILTDRENQELLVITPDYKWNNTNYEYNITTNERFENIGNKEILLMATIYLTNSFITTLVTTVVS